MRNCVLTVFTDCSDREAAEIVFARIKRLELGHIVEIQEINPYHKGGYKVDARFILESESWSELVLEALALAQQLGTGWTLLGTIEEELDLLLSKSATESRFSVAGIQMIELQLFRN